MTSPFSITPPSAPEVPVVISVPHAGVLFPDDIKKEYKSHLISSLDDTDWFVDLLYDFAPSIGIPMIVANYSRWVIDLNRDVDSKPLYTDGRIITALCPTTNFLGDLIYNDDRTFVEDSEVTRRTDAYYRPYHDKIKEMLNERRERFGKVLLWDCHSIRQFVPTIQKENFPDLILGNVDERSAAPEIIADAVKHLGKGSYSFSHNHPFKGGTITRTFGKPELNQHALQLEMSKVNYMNDAERAYDKSRADKMRELLKRTLTSLAEMLFK